MKIPLVALLLISVSTAAAQVLPEPVVKEIEKGNFRSAQQLLRELAALQRLSAIDAYAVNAEIDRLDRIRLDFSKTRDQIRQELHRYYPDLSDVQLDRWESDGSLEMKVIDGGKRYFKNAVPNLFRISSEAKAHKQRIEGVKPDPLGAFRVKHIDDVLREVDIRSTAVVRPVRMTLRYTLTVKPNAVPDGEVIRCWLPYPREGRARQTKITLLSVSSPEYTIAANEHLQRTLYLEKRAERDRPTVFAMDLSFTCYSEYYNLLDRPGSTPPAESPALWREYTAERPPHIVFTDELKEISKTIVGNEQDPVKKAKRIFDWIDRNIPWASALEYSTIPNIPSYCLQTRHGDCGIVTLLFMTLCRLNSIPTRWQSGWMLHPDDVNLHDWCEMYVDGVGWVPVDQSFGLQPLAGERGRYFYFGGIDSYRLIVNDDYGMPLYPAKTYPRSEPYDFQRGEVEWCGGNLYFDQWTYSMRVEYSE